MSDELEWVKIAVSIAGGGLAGAVLTNVITAYRNRIQPVGRRIDITPLFTPNFTGGALKSTIAVSDGTNTYQYANLHMAEVNIVNRGNRDFSMFQFGLTLDANEVCIHADTSTNDRHHTANIVSPITPAQPSSILDFTLQPFNRDDAYTIKLFIETLGAAPKPIKISSAEAVRFTDIPSLAEALEEFASSTSLDIGPFKMSARILRKDSQSRRDWDR